MKKCLCYMRLKIVMNMPCSVPHFVSIPSTLFPFHSVFAIGCSVSFYAHCSAISVKALPALRFRRLLHRLGFLHRLRFLRPLFKRRLVCCFLHRLGFTMALLL
ncbi:hypothetical protein E2542_SST08377 [Spatholobus suberectus]|nr:hypothetical protein E2542_SST08377 [Spatholobus suberectus]